MTYNVFGWTLNLTQPNRAGEHSVYYSLKEMFLTRAALVHVLE